jgi:hypothetical protein
MVAANSISHPSRFRFNLRSGMYSAFLLVVVTSLIGGDGVRQLNLPPANLACTIESRRWALHSSYAEKDLAHDLVLT